MAILWFLYSDWHLLCLPLSSTLCHFAAVISFVGFFARAVFSSPEHTYNNVSFTEDLVFSGGLWSKIMAEGDLNIHCCFTSGAENKCLLT